MMSLPRALALALAQLGDPAILRVLGKTTAITLAIFLLGGVALYVGFETAIDSATSMETGGLGALAAAALVAATARPQAADSQAATRPQAAADLQLE